MAEFMIFNVKIRFYFGFFAALLFYFFVLHFDQSEISAVLVSCLLHELGHISAMCLFSSPPESVCFYAGGIKIIPKAYVLGKRSVTLIIFSAGCIVNFILAAVSYLLGLEQLCLINFSLAAFNLLPFNYFDGGRILELYADSFIRRIAALAFAIIFAFAAVKCSLPIAALLAFALLAEAVMSK